MSPMISGDPEGLLDTTLVAPFGIGESDATNAHFAAFFDETGYDNEAERNG